MAAEMAAEIGEDPEILVELLDFSLPLTDDGKDDDYVPEPVSESSPASPTPTPSKPPPLSVIAASPINKKASPKNSKSKKNNKKSSPPIRVYRDATASKSTKKEEVRVGD